MCMYSNFCCCCSSHSATANIYGLFTCGCVSNKKLKLHLGPYRTGRLRCVPVIEYEQDEWREINTVEFQKMMNMFLYFSLGSWETPLQEVFHLTPSEVKPVSATNGAVTPRNKTKKCLMIIF